MLPRASVLRAGKRQRGRRYSDCVLGKSTAQGGIGWVFFRPGDKRSNILTHEVTVV